MENLFDSCHRARVVIGPVHDAGVQLHPTVGGGDSSKTNRGVSGVRFGHPDSFFDPIEHAAACLHRFQSRLVDGLTKLPG